MPAPTIIWGTQEHERYQELNQELRKCYVRLEAGDTSVEDTILEIKLELYELLTANMGELDKEPHPYPPGTELMFTINGSDQYGLPAAEFEEFTLGSLLDEVRDLATSWGEMSDELPVSSVEMRFVGLDPEQPDRPLSSAEQFSHDMGVAGLEVEHYRGRWFYEGPAVRTDDLQEVLGPTKVPCLWDNLGKGWVVYPER